MAAEKHALLVAVADSPQIRKHPSREIRRLYRILRGCDEDVDLMRDLLVERFGFADDPTLTQVLKTREATQAAILAAVDGLVERAGRDDVVVVYYSGHGSRMRDPHDPDRWLETIVPYDSSRGPEENRDIPDLEIDRWVRRLNDKTPNVTLIFDCCHSGSVTRDPFGEAFREVVADPRPASELFGGAGVPALFAHGRGAAAPRLRSGWLPEGRRAVTVAACRQAEKSWEMKLEDGAGYCFHGVLTYHLVGALSELGSGATWRDALERVAPQVCVQWPAQHPQLEGDIDQIVFGGAQVRARPYLPVVAVDGEGVELWGGAAHGVALGSLWTIRPHGARSRGEGDELARVRLERVRAATSWGRSTAGSTDGLQAGQRAFLLEHEAATPHLAVAIEAAGDRRRELAGHLGTSALLTLVEDPAHADVLVRALEPRPTWAVVGRDGRPAAHPRPARDAGLADLLEALVRLARFRGIRRLANPDAESQLRGRVDLRILDPSGEPAKSDPEHGMVAVWDGDPVDFEIENRHDEEVWVSLLELDCDHSITVLMPRRGHATFRRGGRQLAPGEVLRVGRDYFAADGGLAQGLPQGFPWPADDGEEQEVGVACLKLLVTSVPADFEFLEQPETRFEPTHPLQGLARLYQAGSGKRTVVLPAAAVARDEDWTVITRELGIRRRS